MVLVVVGTVTGNFADASVEFHIAAAVVNSIRPPGIDGNIIYCGHIIVAIGGFCFWNAYF